jgi:RimJ/RimL family protein N-acetyltransferase
MTEPSFARIAGLLPDIPRWVELRDLLHDEEGDILGFRDTAVPTFVLVADEEDMAFVVGTPDPAAVAAAAAQIPDGIVIAAPENAGYVADCLPAWRSERIIVYTLPDAARLPQVDEADVRLIKRADLKKADLPPALREELADALTYSPMAAVFVGGQPVSFCYAASMTERWWDVSIDTVEAHRRRGYPGQSFACLAHHLASRGRGVVWQSLESNPASWRLALRLGFEPVDELVCFTRTPDA